jgi:hypothetical protein
MPAERKAAAPPNSPAPLRPCALAFQLFSSRNDTAAGATAVSPVPPSIVTCGAEAPSNVVRSRDRTRIRARMPSAPHCSPPPASKLRIKKALPTRQWHPRINTLQTVPPRRRHRRPPPQPRPPSPAEARRRLETPCRPPARLRRSATRPSPAHAAFPPRELSPRQSTAAAQLGATSRLAARKQVPNQEIPADTAAPPRRSC